VLGLVVTAASISQGEIKQTNGAGFDKEMPVRARQHDFSAWWPISQRNRRKQSRSKLQSKEVMHALSAIINFTAAFKAILSHGGTYGPGYGLAKPSAT